MTLLEKNMPTWQIALLGIWSGCILSLPLMRAITPLPWDFLLWLLIFDGAAASFVVCPLVYMSERASAIRSGKGK